MLDTPLIFNSPFTTAGMIAAEIWMRPKAVTRQWKLHRKERRSQRTTKTLMNRKQVSLVDRKSASYCTAQLHNESICVSSFI